MTTIACNKDEMYGDLQYTNGTFKFKGNSKVWKFKAHPKTYHCDYIVGFSGTASSILDAVDYFTNPDNFRKAPKIRELYGLVLTAERDIYRFDNYTKWIQVDAPYAATGSGAGPALGALAAGASPKEAVKVASQHDTYTGLGIKGYRI